MKKTGFILVLHSLIAFPLLAEILLTNGNFEDPGGTQKVEITNGVDHDAVMGWRCFAVDVADRRVAFEIVREGVKTSPTMEMHLFDNPSGLTEGRIGFDVNDRKLAVKPGEKYALKFQARQAGPNPLCAQGVLRRHRRRRNPGVRIQQNHRAGP